MPSGLDIAGTQQQILDYIEANAPTGYQVVEGDVADALTITEVDGVRQPTWVVQFGDTLSEGGSGSFYGPTHDGYYSIFRVYSIGYSAAQSRKGNSVANQLVLGARFDNVGAIGKVFGGGSFTIGEANSRPVAYVSIASFRFSTNLSDVGSKVYP